MGDLNTTLYDAISNETATIDPLGNRTTMAYDALNRLTQTKDALGDLSTVVYDAAGNKLADVDALGHRTSYAYDALDRVTTTTDALGDVATTVFDAVGNQIATIDPRGFRTTYAFDVLNRQTQMTDALNDLSTTVYDADGNTIAAVDARGNRTSYAYDALDRLTQTTDALGDLSTVVYDAAGNKLADVDALGHRTSYAFDALNRLTTTTDALGDVSTTLYDASGNKIADVDPLGNRTTYAYDALNRLTQTTDPLNNLTTVVYDAAGNKIVDVDARDYATTYSYDAVNRLTQTQDALGDLSTVVYDAAGNEIADVDARGNRTTMAYDALNRVTATTDALNHTTTTGYDADGNQTVVIDALGDRTTTSYDALDRTMTVQNPNGGVFTTLYDKVGNVTGTIDALGNRTTTLYDVLNRKTVDINADGAATSYQYDAVGDQIALTDPDGNTTTFVFDALNRQTKEIDPLGHVSTVAYDAAGRQTSATDRLGNVQNETYDANGQQLTDTWVTSGSTVNIQTYSYDADGNQRTAQDFSGAYTMAYDALDRVTVQDEPFNQSLTYSYDPVGNRTLVVDSQGGTTTSVYNAVNLLTSRQFNNGTTPLREDFTYTATNQQATATRYSDLAGTTVVGTTVYSYDSSQRVTSITDNNSAGATVASFNYAYDQDSRLTQQTAFGASTTYSYDAAGQLIGANTTSYHYDANGNRNAGGYTVGSDNQMLTDASGYSYTYDAAGEQIKKSLGSNADTWYYGFNAQGQLTSVIERAADSPTATLTYSVTYTYDVYGQLLQQDEWTASAGTVTTRFANDSGEVWADLTSGNALAVRYVRPDGTNTLGARISSSGTAAWYLPDYQGSVMAMTDNSGVVQDQDTYDPFGALVNETNASFGDRYHYTGEPYNYHSKDQLNGIRWYNTVTGSWTRPDPIGLTDGSNPYDYARNAPTNGTDPTGLFDQRTFMDDFQKLDATLYAFMQQYGAIFFARFYIAKSDYEIGKDGKLSVILDDRITVEQAISEIHKAVQAKRGDQYSAFLRAQDYQTEVQKLPPTVVQELPSVSKAGIDQSTASDNLARLALLRTRARQRAQLLLLTVQLMFGDEDTRPDNFSVANFDDQLFLDTGDPAVQAVDEYLKKLSAWNSDMPLLAQMTPEMRARIPKKFLVPPVMNLSGQQIARYQAELDAYIARIDAKAPLALGLLLPPAKGPSVGEAPPLTKLDKKMEAIRLALASLGDGGNPGTVHALQTELQALHARKCGGPKAEWIERDRQAMIDVRTPGGFWLNHGLNILGPIAAGYETNAGTNGIVPLSKFELDNGFTSPQEFPPLNTIPRFQQNGRPLWWRDFYVRLEQFRGNNDRNSNLSGGEGELYLSTRNRFLVLKRWHASRLKDMAESVGLLIRARTVIEGNPKLNADLDVVKLYELGSDWILREFDPDSLPLKDAIEGGSPKAAEARARVIAELEAQEKAGTLSEVSKNVLKKVRKGSDNIHWSPTKGKLLVIDLQ